MSRFFKSAAFPILIVVVLAFFAQKLIGSHRATGRTTRSATCSPSSQQRQGRQALAGPEVQQRRRHADRRHEVLRVGYPDNYAPTLINDAIHDGVGANQVLDVQSKSIQRLALAAHLPAAVRDLFIGFWIFLMNQVQGGGSKVMSLRQVAGQANVGRLAEDHLPGRGGGRRGRRGAARDQGVPREPQEVPGARRADPQGRAAVRPSGHRQDAAGARRRRRGGRAVLLDLRL